MKKFTTLLLALVMVLTLAASSVAYADDVRNINWFTVRSGGWPLMQEIIDEFNEIHPNVHVELIPGPVDRTTYYQQLKLMAGSDELPDLFDSDADTTLMQMASLGLLVDVDELLADINYDRMVPIGLNYARFSNGKLYTIDFENNLEFFWYRKDLFAQAGVETIPSTWDEFFDACEKLKAASITPIAVCAGWPALRWISFYPFRLTGNEFIESLKTGETKMNSELGLQAAEFFQRLAGNYFMADWATSDYNGALEAFTSGSAAIHNTGSWQFGSFLNPVPEEGEEPEEGKIPGEIADEYGYFMLPMLPNSVNDEYAMCAHAGTGVSISASSYDDDVKEFITYMLDAYPDKAFWDYNVFPCMTFDENKGELTDFQKVQIDMSEKLSSYMFTWDVRLDSASNDVMLKEIQVLGMGLETPEEFANHIDEAIAENAPRFFGK